MHHSAWSSYAPIPECLCWRSKDDGGQQFRCVRASLETLSLRGRHHSSPPGLLLQVRLMEDREIQSACVCRDSAAPPVSMCMNTQQPCALWDRQCTLLFISCRLQQSLVPQTRGTRGGEPIERHVGSYLSAFFRLLGESVCVLLAGRGREWETVVCGCSQVFLLVLYNYSSVIAEDDLVQDFLWIDNCAKIADKVGPLFAWLACVHVCVSCDVRSYVRGNTPSPAHAVSPSAVPACHGVRVLQKGQPHPGSVHQSQLLCSTVSGHTHSKCT